MTYTQDSDVDLNTLEDSIKSIAVTDSIQIYQLLQAKNIEVPANLKQSLLELVAFYNHANTLPEDLIEERIFVENVKRTEQPPAWKNDDFAEQLFEEIEPKSPEAYNALIRGMCRHLQAQKGYALYQTALEKGIPIDVGTFNSVISAAYWMERSLQPRWELITKTLQTMASSNVKPDLHTLNAVLWIISKMGIYNMATNFCLQTLAEFKKLGVEPSLGSYYYVLATFSKDNCPTSAAMVDVLDLVEGREWKAQSLADQHFFSSAMAICRHHLNDADLARRLDAFLHFGRNYDLIGNTHREMVYYRNYLAVLLESEPMNVFMDTYKYIVPNITTPEAGIIKAILDTIDAQGALEHIPKLWSDIIIFDHTNKGVLLTQIIQIMAKNKPISEIESHAGLVQKFAEIVWDIYTIIENQPAERFNRIDWEGQMLDDTLVLLCRADEFEKAQKIFELSIKKQNVLMTTIQPFALEEFVHKCIAHAQPSLAIQVLKYAVENATSDSHELNNNIARQIVTSFTLNEGHLSQVVSLVGHDVVKSFNE